MSTKNKNGWLLKHWPNARVVDKNWTMSRYDYPQEVRDWIESNWIKINDNNGGTWSEPEYYKTRIQKKTEQQSVENPEDKDKGESKDAGDDASDAGRSFAQEYNKTTFYKGMDDNNKKALNVMAKEGMEAAVKHMFTDSTTGHQLSYGEMRSRYG